MAQECATMAQKCYVVAHPGENAGIFNWLAERGRPARRALG
jgi:hypothetical protein